MRVVGTTRLKPQGSRPRHNYNPRCLAWLWLPERFLDRSEVRSPLSARHADPSRWLKPATSERKRTHHAAIIGYCHRCDIGSSSCGRRARAIVNECLGTLGRHHRGARASRLPSRSSSRPRAGGAWNGAISIPAQHISAFPLSDITVKDAEVGFAMKGVPGDPTIQGQSRGRPAHDIGTDDAGRDEHALHAYVERRAEDRGAAKEHEGHCRFRGDVGRHPLRLARTSSG